MENATSEFLNAKYLRWRAVIELEDVQPLFGGARLTLDGSGKARVEEVARGGQASQYRAYLHSSRAEELWQLCIAQDFLTIRPEERPGLPDEARPAITLRNFLGDEHKVSKWAGVEDDRFDAIYQVLLDIIEQAKTPRPLPPPEPMLSRAAPILAVLGFILLVIMPVWPAYQSARRVVLPAGLEEPALLVRPLLLAAASVPLLLGVLAILELRAGQGRGFFWRDASLLLFLVGIGYIITLFALPSIFIGVGMTRWGETAVATIETKKLTVGLDYTTDTPTSETTYTLHYSFQTATGKTFTGRADVGQRTYNTIAEGDTLTVYYLSSLPRFSRLEAATSAASRAVWILTAQFTLLGWLVIIGLSAFGVWPLIKHRKKDNRKKPT